MQSGPQRMLRGVAQAPCYQAAGRRLPPVVHVPPRLPTPQGYTLFASAFIGGPLTGAALNPARVFGPALIYNCFW